jgi:hypothetical protein
MFNELDSDRSFNIIDDILAEQLLRNEETNNGLTEVRLRIDKLYWQLSEEEMEEPGYIPGNYTPQTEMGYEGLLPPLQG